MTRISTKKISDKNLRKYWNQLLKAIIQSQNQITLNTFFDGLFTQTEQVVMTKRFIAQLLILSGVSVRKISQTLNLSTSTIFVLKAELNFNPNYVKLLKKYLTPPKKPTSISFDFLSDWSEVLEVILAGKQGYVHYRNRYPKEIIPKKK
jgi:uncharacterized protein YerC